MFSYSQEENEYCKIPVLSINLLFNLVHAYQEPPNAHCQSSVCYLCWGGKQRNLKSVMQA